jgi:hypothetical protein
MLLPEKKKNSENGKNIQGEIENLDPLPFIVGELASELSKARGTGQDQRRDEDPPELWRKPGGLEDA